jgi:microcystin degradation protein MlrC
MVTGFDRAVIEHEASRLAQTYWEARRQFTFGVPAGTIDQCLEWALAAPEIPVFISDSGDNPTAGGVGDTSIVLERLLAWQVPSAVMASIPDAAAVQVCQQAGLGGEVSLSLGGKLDPIHSQSLPVTGQVLHLTKADPVGGDIAVVQVDQVKVIVTERRKPFH